MPVMVMRHLSVRQPRLHRMRQVPVTTDARMLLQRFGDPDQTGCPEHGVVQWDNELRRDVPDERVQQVIKPVILRACAFARMLMRVCV